MLVDLTVFQHCLFKQTFKPTNAVKRNKGMKVSVQAEIEDFKGVFQVRIRTMVRQGIFDEILEGMTHGTSSSGVGRMTGTSKGTVATAWKVRSNELLTAFHVDAQLTQDVALLLLTHFAARSGHGKRRFDYG